MYFFLSAQVLTKQLCQLLSYCYQHQIWVPSTPSRSVGTLQTMLLSSQLLPVRLSHEWH